MMLRFPRIDAADPCAYGLRVDDHATMDSPSTYVRPRPRTVPRVEEAVVLEQERNLPADGQPDGRTETRRAEYATNMSI